MPSAICAITASTVRCSTSPWCDSMQWTTSGDSFIRRAISAPMIAWEPSISCVTAFPTSCRRAPRLGIAGSMPSSEAIADAMCADSTRCFSTFCPYEVRNCNRPSSRIISGCMSVMPTSSTASSPARLICSSISRCERSNVSSIRAGWIRPSCTSFPGGRPPLPPPDGVERRQHDRLGRVVDDEVHTGRALERADVPSLTTDDPALHVLGREREHGDGRLTRVFGRDALDGDRDDLARTLLALLSRPLLDLSDGGHGFAASLVEHLRLQSVARFLCGHLRDLLETPAVLFGSVLELLPNHLEGPVAVVELLGPSTELVDLGLDCLVLLGEPFLQTLDLLASGAELLLRVLPKCSDLVLGFDERLAGEAFGLPLSFEDHLLCASLCALGLGLPEDLPDEEPDAETRRQSRQPHNDRIHRYSSKRNGRMQAHRALFGQASEVVI